MVIVFGNLPGRRNIARGPRLSNKKRVFRPQVRLDVIKARRGTLFACKLWFSSSRAYLFFEFHMKSSS